MKNTYGQEKREELVDDQVGDVLGLRSHADGLGTNVHGEDLSGPDPDGGTPGRLVEENEEEQQEHDRDGHGLGLRGWGLSLDGCDDDHAESHTDTTDDEQEAATKAVDSPGRVEGEEDTEGGVESVDEGDGRRGLEDFLVDLGGVAVERALTSDLLTGVDDKSEHQTLADGAILPESRVGR